MLPRLQADERPSVALRRSRVPCAGNHEGLEAHSMTTLLGLHRYASYIRCQHSFLSERHGK